MIGKARMMFENTLSGIKVTMVLKAQMMLEKQGSGRIKWCWFRGHVPCSQSTDHAAKVYAMLEKRSECK